MNLLQKGPLTVACLAFTLLHFLCICLAMPPIKCDGYPVLIEPLYM